MAGVRAESGKVPGSEDRSRENSEVKRKLETGQKLLEIRARPDLRGRRKEKRMVSDQAVEEVRMSKSGRPPARPASRKEKSAAR